MSEAKARKASPAKGRKTTKTKRRVAPAATRVKRRSISDPSKDLKEARAQQAATAEILKVIASSPSDVQPVFEAIATSAKRLLGGFSTAVFRILEATVHLAAFTPVNPFADQALKADFPQSTENFVAFRLAQHGEPVVIADTEGESHPPVRDIARLHGFRSMLWVPMVNGGVTIGIISVTRAEPGGFAPHHIQLLKTFADQAVIAIENTRLFNETKEALERQTATSEVLKVISGSPGELEPVFNAMLENAVRICDAKFGNLLLIDGDSARWAAGVGTPLELAQYLQSASFRPTPGSHLDRVMRTKQVSHATDDTTQVVIGASARLGGARSTVCVPMVKDEALVGAIFMYRTEVRPFTEKQIDLVKNFAAQAVIAIENARLLKELRQRTRELTESLEQQTATSEVLEVISSSPGDLQPVFKSMLNNALRICEAQFGQLLLFDGTGFLAAELHNTPADYAELFKRGPLVPGPNTGLGRLIASKKAIHISDVVSGSLYAERDPLRIATVDILQARTLLAVPMLKDDELVGAIIIYRQEVRPFSDRQVELVTNFAAQAVIAIENTRLLRELRESLQQQTATADVLKVISRSAFDLDTVMATLSRSAAELCGADTSALYLREGELLVARGISATDSTQVDFLRQNPLQLGEETFVGRAVLTGSIANIPDAQDEIKGAVRRFAIALGYRAILILPLMREGRGVGVFALARRQVGAFTPRQIELVQTFADQAVIAIENVRLFDEVQARTQDLTESLEQQTATSEVLQVISTSPGELEPVFRIMLESATRVCGANFGMMQLWDGETFSTAAAYNVPPAFAALREGKPIHVHHPQSGLSNVLTSHQVVHIHDVTKGAAYLGGDPNVVQLADIGGARTVVLVPMLKEDEFIGTFTIYRQEVRPFTDKQIALVENFTKQAVIAIENTRLLRELRERTTELSRSLEDLRAAQDRLVQTEKLASLGQLTAGIAHEIKNPLNFVNNFSALSTELIEEMKDMLSDVSLDKNKRRDLDEITKMLKDNLDKVVQHGKRADSIVKNMLLHSRQGSGEYRSVDINAIVDESLNLAYHGARAENAGFNITMHRSFDSAVGMADGYPQEITRALLNLISNGFYAATKRNVGDGFEPTLTATTKNLGDQVEIRIRDNGTGIPTEVKEKIFNPFFTTKPAGEGTGLGLSMSHDIIVKQHGGTIDVDTVPGVFTEFKIVLPRAGAFLIKPGEHS